MRRAWFDWMPSPRYTTASISGCSATSAITSGIVSRVSPPARSIGLFRLQRGGSFVSIASRRSSGSGASTSSRCAVIASAVTTPQPPAVVSTATFGPCGRGWVAKVAAASNASSTFAARVAPAWRHMPSNTRSSLASAPVWLAAARWPPAVAPPLRRTSGMRAVTVRMRSENARPSAMPSTYASPTAVAASSA